MCSDFDPSNTGAAGSAVACITFLKGSVAENRTGMLRMSLAIDQATSKGGGKSESTPLELWF